MPDVNDFVAAINDRKVYIGKVIEVDYTDANISFLTYKGEQYFYISWANLRTWNLGGIFKYYLHSASPLRDVA